MAEDGTGVTLTEPAFGFIDERRERALIKVSTTDIAKIVGQHFLGRIPEQLPRNIGEGIGGVRLDGVKHEPHDDGAALDVVRARAKDDFAFGLPAEVVALFLFGREDGVEMRDHGDGAVRLAASRQDQVIAEGWVCRSDGFGREAERREAFRRVTSELVHAVAILGEAVHADHSLEEDKRGGHLRGDELVQGRLR